MNRGLPVAASFLTGVLAAVQSRINADLADRVGSAVIAATVSFGIGLLITAALILPRSRFRQSLRRIPEALRLGDLHRWQLLGGLGGAWIVTTQGLVVTVAGVTTFTIGLVAGQVTGSLVVDRAGLSPAGHMAITASRAAAAVLALVAVALVAIRGGGVSLSWVVLLAVSAGAAISVQQAINAEVAVVSGHPLSATLVNLLVGTVALLVISLALLASGGIGAPTWPGDPRLYLGGVIAVAIVALGAWAVHSLGVLVFGLLSIAGLVLGSVIIDLLGVTHAIFGWRQWVGLALVTVAVVLAASPARRGEPTRA